MPYHVAIIMDGNGRWARERNLPRTAGHKKGIERVKEIVRAAKNMGVKILTIFTFSTENWSRPKEEVDFLFSYLDSFLTSYRKELLKERIRLNLIGRRDRINSHIIKKIEELEVLTLENKEFIFNIALDYGGRWDILNALKKLFRDYIEKRISLEGIDEEVFKRYLSLAGQPEPDLLIRTSGEQRISNFLLWDLAYSEFYFPEVYWPDFDAKELEKAILEYNKRERRFGGLG